MKSTELFEEYITDAKSQLVCNNVDIDNIEYILFYYTDSSIDDNRNYFMDCFNSNLSSYKALTFFYDYLQSK